MSRFCRKSGSVASSTAVACEALPILGIVRAVADVLDAALTLRPDGASLGVRMSLMSFSRKSTIITWFVRVLIVASLIGGTFPGGDASSALAQIFKGSKVQPGSGRVNSGGSQGAIPNWFTVMGEVRYPQTYELPTSSPSVVDLLRFSSAGWPSPLSPRASGQVRIIRAGREVQKLFYSDSLSLTLMPGDLLIVDSKSGQGQIHQGKRSQTGGQPDTVKIALVGVLDHTFIMAAPAEMATTDWIARQLGQNPSIAKTADRLLPRSHQQTNAETRLPDNSVVFFMPGQIDSSKLPPDLPRPFRAGVDQRPHADAPTQPAIVPDESLPNPPGRAFVPNIQPSVPNGSAIPDAAVGQPADAGGDGSVQLDPERVDPPVNRESVIDPRNPEGRARVGRKINEPNRFTPPAGVASVGPTPTEESQTESSLEASKPKSQQIKELPLEPVPEQGLPADNERPTSTVVSEPDFNARVNAGGSLSILGANSASAAGSQLPTLAKEVASDADAELATSDTKALVEKDANPTDWSGIIIILLTSVGLGALCWLALSMGPRTPTAARVAAVPPKPRKPELSSAQLIDRLINNELPIEIEPARLPADLRVHGRPISTPRLRVDAAHQAGPKRPHFVVHRPDVAPASPPRTVAPVGVVEDVATSQKQVADESQTTTANESVAAKSGRKLRFDAPAAMPTSNATVDGPTIRGPLGLRSFLPESADESRPGREVSVVQPERVTQPAANSSAVASDVRVKPSRVITEGGDIVDRALAAFHQAKGQT